MRKVYLLLIALAAFFVSCQTSIYTETQTRQNHPTFATNVIPLAADLQVSPQRIVEDVKITPPVNSVYTTEIAKEHAIAATLKKYNADVLVAPLINVYKENTTYHITVIGYPATLKNFRNATQLDCIAYKKFKR